MPSSPLTTSSGRPMLTATLVASGALTRNCARSSELILGYCWPGALDEAGFQSSAGGAVWAAHGLPDRMVASASRDSRFFHILVLLSPAPPAGSPGHRQR